MHSSILELTLYSQSFFDTGPLPGLIRATKTKDTKLLQRNSFGRISDENRYQGAKQKTNSAARVQSIVSGFAIVSKIEVHPQKPPYHCPTSYTRRRSQPQICTHSRWTRIFWSDGAKNSTLEYSRKPQRSSENTSQAGAHCHVPIELGETTLSFLKSNRHHNFHSSDFPDRFANKPNSISAT